MQKRDNIILTIAIVCGLLAFLLVANVLKNSNARHRPVALPKKHIKAIAIPGGMRGLTLSVKDIENIPNPLNTGSYVDVLGMAPNYVGNMELQTIAQSVQIVGIDQPAGDKKEDLPQEIRSITLALSPITAEIVSKAMITGKIHLMVRSDGADAEGFQLGAVGISEIIRGVSKEKTMRVDR